MSIGKNIAKYRKSAGLTQEELGVKLGVTNQSVSKWESGVSMPDIMLLPKIASALGITLENIYGTESESEKNPVSADDFPDFCYTKLIELFYYNTIMRFTHIGASDREQLDFLAQKLAEGCRIGCISNTRGATVLSDGFAFVELDYKSDNHEKLARVAQDAACTLTSLSDPNVRKVLFYQYAYAVNNSKKDNSEFTRDEVMRACDMTESDADAALRRLKELCINSTYTVPETKTKKYVFSYSNAVYALAIYKLSELLTDDAVWEVVRDTSMINDYAFK